MKFQRSTNLTTPPGIEKQLCRAEQQSWTLMKPDRSHTRVCGARRKHHRGYCQKSPLKGHWRCKLHGGASTGPTSPEGKAQTVAAMVAGRRRWVERMNRAKAEGRIEKFPGGRQPGQKGRRRTGNRVIDMAVRQIEAGALNLPEPSPTPDRPFHELEPHEKFAVLSRLSLAFTLRLLRVPCDPAIHPKVARMQQDVARTVLSLTIRFDPDAMRAKKPGRLLALQERLRDEAGV